MQCRTWIRIRNSRLKWFTFLLELKKRIRVHWSELCRYFGSKIFPTYQSVTEISTAISTKSDWQVSLGKLFSISGYRIADVSLTPILSQPSTSWIITITPEIQPDSPKKFIRLVRDGMFKPDFSYLFFIFFVCLLFFRHYFRSCLNCVVIIYAFKARWYYSRGRRVANSLILVQHCRTDTTCEWLLTTCMTPFMSGKGRVYGSYRSWSKWWTA